VILRTCPLLAIFFYDGSEVTFDILSFLLFLQLLFLKKYAKKFEYEHLHLANSNFKYVGRTETSSVPGLADHLVSAVLFFPLECLYITLINV
jgi:hypothetical protein